MYLTAAVDEDMHRANAVLSAYMEQYYGPHGAAMRARQVCYAGPSAGLAEWLQGYAAAGAAHLVLRFAGNHERHLEVLAGVRARLGW
jgi:hypothetical protein